MSIEERNFIYNMFYSIIKRQNVIIEQLTSLTNAYAKVNGLATEENEGDLNEVKRPD